MPDLSAPPPITPEQRADDARLCREVLLELIAIGAEHARLALKRDAARTEAATAALPPAGAPQATPDPASEYERVTRAIRRSMLLLERLGDTGTQRTAAARTEQRPAARRRILRELEDELARDVPEPQASALHAELLERLDSPECDEEIDTRPVAEVVLEIRRDLGLATEVGCEPYFMRRTPADVAELHDTAAQPSGAAARRAARPPEPDPVYPPPKPRPSFEELAGLCTTLLNGSPRVPPF